MTHSPQSTWMRWALRERCPQWTRNLPTNTFGFVPHVNLGERREGGVLRFAAYSTPKQFAF
ncbi:hypothetical protein MUK42_07314 [Musa troglodytarum]|uniref:Uncharacterized protein n=1 Tax=Musa troglodytarum TaxID=320322 RepID=A0A9E7FN95_9LILI|nr:hypothetical protein MUK42_07314 [Musa troglodytarum]